jgi:uncharacterized membrane protein
MDKKIVENVLFIIVGVILLGVVELKLINLTDILTIIVGFIGFAALLNGAFGLYNIIRSEKHEN